MNDANKYYELMKRAETIRKDYGSFLLCAIKYDWKDTQQVMEEKFKRACRVENYFENKLLVATGHRKPSNN